MSQRDPEAFLHDMLDRCIFVLQTVEKMTRHQYDTERLSRSGIERELSILGEALFQINRIAPELAAQIPHYERIIGFRHLLVHAYHIIDNDIVWDVLTNGDLAALKMAVEKLLRQYK